MILSCNAWLPIRKVNTIIAALTKMSRPFSFFSHYSVRQIIEWQQFVILIALLTIETPCLFFVGVLDKRFALSAFRAVAGRNFVVEIFLQVGIGRQPAALLPELRT